MVAADARPDAGGTYPDLDRAIESGYASFSQLAVADWGQVTEGSEQPAFRYYYPRLLRAFESSHGTIEDKYSSAQIQCCVARTAPAPNARVRSETDGKAHTPKPVRARQPDFHFVYNLAFVPVGGELLTRIEMMASDATRMLEHRKLAECLDQLYSKTTDVLAIVEAATEAIGEKTDRGPALDQPVAPRQTNGHDAPGDQPQRAPLPAPSSNPAVISKPEVVERLAIVRHDLDVIELKYLITDARLKYFFGAFVSTLAIAVAVGLAAALAPVLPALGQLGRSFALVVILGAVGALLSVVQRLSSDSLDVRYDLGATYTRLLGGFRPVVGAFGGLLVWMLLQAHVLANPTGSDFFPAALAFGLGVAERSLGDVVTQTGIISRLTPGRPMVAEKRS